jgi:predicted Fe-Mo cluster-binding NifX family protein
MKVVVAANGPTLDSLVAKRFGHAPYYLLLDSTTRELQVIENREHGDETHAIIPQQAGQGAVVFIAGNIGPHAFQFIQSLQRQVALARRMPAGEALNKLEKGELELLSAPTVKHSQHDLRGDHAHHSA